MSVACALRRKSQMTKMTSAIEMKSSTCTSATVARMVAVRSVTTVTCTLPGNVSVRRGKSFVTLSATAMTFAPGCRCTERMIACRTAG